MNGAGELPEKLVLYDGVCNLCDGWVRFVLPRDKGGKLRFASLQSEFAKKIMTQRGIATPETPESLILIENGQAYFYSAAALRIAGNLGFPWNLALVFLVIPRPIRDLVYRFVARNRYRWFGKQETCLLPNPKYRARFLD